MEKGLKESLNNMKDRVLGSSITSYVMDHAVILVCAFILYYRTFFRCLGTHTLKVSIWILIGIVLSCMTVGIIMSVVVMRETDSYLSVFRNVAAGFIVYTFICYWNERTTVFLAFIGGVLAFEILNLFFTKRMIKASKNSKERRKRVNQAVSGSINILTIGMIVFLVSLYAQLLLSHTVLKPSVVAERLEGSDYDTMFESNRNTLELLDEEKWKSLSSQERLNVAKVVADLECCYLGIGDPVPVEASELDDSTLAEFDDHKRIITINTKNLEERRAEQVLDSVLHEIHHYYASLLCILYEDASDEFKNLAIFKNQNVDKYSEEFSAYIDGNGSDFEAYENQELEKAARQYARSRSYSILYKLGLAGADRQMKVVYGENGKGILYSHEGNAVSEEHDYIEDGVYNRSGIRRYMDDGKIGLIGAFGGELTAPKYLEVTSFGEGDWAMVREDEDTVYYVNEKGERVTKDYCSGFEPAYSGMFAVVETENGTLSLINRNDDTVFDGATYFGDFPIGGRRILTAVKDDHVVLLRLFTDGDFGRCEVVHEYKDYNSVRELWDQFAIVTTPEGWTGVIQLEDGAVLIPAQFKSIQYIRMNGEKKNKTKAIMSFRAVKQDGSMEFYKFEFPD